MKYKVFENNEIKKRYYANELKHPNKVIRVFGHDVNITFNLPLKLHAIFTSSNTRPTRLFFYYQDADDENVLTAENLFNDITVDGNPINLSQLNNNQGLYTFDKKGTHDVIYSLKNDYINNNMFEDCVDLLSIEIPNELREIGGESFKGCLSLEDVDIDIFMSNIIGIGPYAFENCESLTSFTVPKEVSIITEGTFQNCASLSQIYFFEDTNQITVANQNVFGIRAINDKAFLGCTNLTNIQFPKNTYFRGMNLHSPNYITIEIHNQAFAGSGLTEVTIPDHYAEMVSSGIFQNCDNLERAYIHSTKITDKIPAQTFAGCTNLNQLYIDSVSVLELRTDALSNTSEDLEIYVPTSLLNDYKADSTWANYSDKIYANE